MKNSSKDIKKNTNVIAIVGMAGSGKSEAGKFFKKKKFTVLRFGDVVDDGIKAEGLPWTPENNVYYRSKIREELGMAAVAIKMMPKIQQALQRDENIILDGLYSWEEYTYLHEQLPHMFLLCIYTRPAIRYARLAKRKDRPFSKEDAMRRDITEIEAIHKAGPIAFSDYLVKNESNRANFTKQLNIFWKDFIHRK
jgi:dephospho-CoA kinase